MSAAQGTSQRARGWVLGLLPALLYAAAAAVALRSGLSTERAVGQGVDLCGTLWYVEWIRHCVTEGVNPGFSDWFFHPTGKDIFAHTGSNFVDTLLVQPLRALLGWPAYYGAGLVALLTANGLAMQRLLRGRGASLGVAVFLSLIFALHPYSLYELSQGRPTQVTLFWLPLALHHLLRLSDGGPLRHAALAGSFFALLGWTYWFNGHFVLLMIGPLCLALLWRARDRLRFSKGLGLMVGVCLLLVAPPLLLMAQRAAAGAVPGLDQAAFGSMDTSVFDPRLAFGVRWLGGAGDHGLPLPVRLLVLLGAGLALSRRRWLWAPGLVLGMLVMAGPAFAIGDALVDNPVYRACEAALPFFERLWFPYRGWGVLAVLSALPVAEAMGRIRLGLPAAARWPLLVAAGLIFSSFPELLMQPIATTPLPRPAYTDAVRAAPGLVLDLPFLCSEEAMHYQPLHGSPLVGGMAEGTQAFRPADLRERVYGDPLLAAVASASLTGQAPAEPPAHDPSHPVRWVVLQKHLYPGVVAMRGCWEGPQLDGPGRVRAAQRALERLLGPPTVEDHVAAAWDLSAD